MEQKKWVFLQMKVDREFKDLVQQLATDEYTSMSYIIKKAVMEYAKSKGASKFKIAIKPRHRNVPSKD